MLVEEALDFVEDNFHSLNALDLLEEALMVNVEVHVIKSSNPNPDDVNTIFVPLEYFYAGYIHAGVWRENPIYKYAKTSPFTLEEVISVLEDDHYEAIKYLKNEFKQSGIKIKIEKDWAEAEGTWIGIPIKSTKVEDYELSSYTWNHAKTIIMDCIRYSPNSELNFRHVTDPTIKEIEEILRNILVDIDRTEEDWTKCVQYNSELIMVFLNKVDETYPEGSLPEGTLQYYDELMEKSLNP